MAKKVSRSRRSARVQTGVSAAIKSGQAMAEDYDYTEEVRALAVPTMIVAGDADMCPPSHFVEVFKLLDGGGQGRVSLAELEARLPARPEGRRAKPRKDARDNRIGLPLSEGDYRSRL